MTYYALIHPTDYYDARAAVELRRSDLTRLRELLAGMLKGTTKKATVWRVERGRRRVKILEITDAGGERWLGPNAKEVRNH